MASFRLKPERIFDGEKFLVGASIAIENGQVIDIGEASDSACVELEGTLVAGFIDVQVNGGNDVLFNQSPTLASIQQIVRAHQSFGTTGCLPTLITDSFDQMSRAADAMAEAIAEKVPSVLGIHFEGPHLATAKKGVHNANFIRHISKQDIALFCRKDLGKVVITVAPENVSTEVIGELVSEGVIVCLGHSNASYEQACAALEAGATGFTHLFNAMSSMNSRAPGMVGAALADQDSWCGMIMDGIHVHPGAAQVALNAKQNIMLVTDAMPPVGSDKKSFELLGKTIQREGMQLTDEHGQLAGSALDMAAAVRFCQQNLVCSDVRAFNMASYYPAKFLGLDDEIGSLQVGKQASMVLLNEKGEVNMCWVDGVKVYSKHA